MFIWGFFPFMLLTFSTRRYFTLHFLSNAFVFRGLPPLWSFFKLFSKDRVGFRILFLNAVDDGGGVKRKTAFI